VTGRVQGVTSGACSGHWENKARSVEDASGATGLRKSVRRGTGDVRLDEGRSSLTWLCSTRRQEANRVCRRTLPAAALPSLPQSVCLIVLAPKPQVPPLLESSFAVHLHGIVRRDWRAWEQCRSESIEQRAKCPAGSDQRTRILRDRVLSNAMRGEKICGLASLPSARHQRLQMLLEEVLPNPAPLSPAL
jgi:hypothetical protein